MKNPTTGMVLFATLFATSFMYAQTAENNTIQPIKFKSEKEKQEWIINNPEQYKDMKQAADQISATYIGSLLTVEQPEVFSVEIQQLEKEIKENSNNPEYDLELMKQKLEKAKASELNNK